MRVLATATLIGFVYGRISERLAGDLKGDCDCSWITIPGACNPPGDGSPCWTECCVGPTPTPPPPTPTPPPGPNDCKCDWKNQPGACDFYGAYFDDSACWKNCCGGSPVPGPTPAPGDSKACNLVNESNNQDVGNGFTRTGGMRYHSQEKLDLLGGGLSFTVDLSKVNDMVNANLYLVIPGTLMGGSHFYCDNSQNFVNQGNACIELDIFESNGHQLSASTMHTYVGTNTGGCDTYGCRQLTYFGNPIDANRPFNVHVRVANDGDLTVQFEQDGRTQWAFQNGPGFDGAAKAAIANGMRNHGAIVMSSLWTGWVPPNNSGKGNLDGSTYTVSNLRYEGRSKGRV